MIKHNLSVSDIAEGNIIEKIPLCDQTISRRVSEIAEHLEDELLKEVRQSPVGFSIQLDESVDVENIAQLVVYARLDFFQY